jgi:hypothetical protein
MMVPFSPTAVPVPASVKETAVRLIGVGRGFWRDQPDWECVVAWKRRRPVNRMKALDTRLFMRTSETSASQPAVAGKLECKGGRAWPVGQTSADV